MSYFKKKYVDESRFISYFTQIDLATSATHQGGTVLEVGVGNGTVSDFLRKLGFRLTTCDIDSALTPDVVADVRSLPFSERAFDTVMACEILEHLPFEDFERALRELERVAKSAVIISLPYRSSSIEIVLKFPLIRSLFKRPWLDFFLRIPLSFSSSSSKQHHWEIDRARFPLRRIRESIRRQFQIEREVRPVLQSYHYFFVLRRH